MLSNSKCLLFKVKMIPGVFGVRKKRWIGIFIAITIRR
jgi:hypothetical protein